MNARGQILRRGWAGCGVEILKRNQERAFMIYHRVFTQELSQYFRVGNLVLAFCLSCVASVAQNLDLDNLRGTLVAGVHTLSGTVTVTGDLEIPPDATVRVEAGTTLRFDGRFRSFIVQGVLELKGTASSPITCTSLENSGPDQWGGLFSLQAPVERSLTPNSDLVGVKLLG